MKFRHVVAFLLMLLPALVKANVIQYTFPVSTYIDKSNFYSYGLQLQIIPSSFKLDFDDVNWKFKDKTLEINSISDIPLSEGMVGFTYDLTLLENSSVCYFPSVLSRPSINDFILLSVKGSGVHVSDMPVNSSIKGILFNDLNLDGKFVGRLDMTLRHNPLKLFDKNVDKSLVCSGEILLEAEISL